MSAVSFKELEMAIGMSAAIELCDEYGGTTVTVPARPRPTHPVARQIGVDKARALHRAFGPVRLDLPLGPTRGQRGRRTKVAQLIDRGYSVAEAARQGDVHQRTVYRIKQQVHAAPLPLFDRRDKD